MTSRITETLSGHYYTDPAIFDAEMASIFSELWVCVGRADRVQSPGDYFCPTVGAESLIVTRGEDGRARAFFNTCPHRGTQICDAERSGHARTFQCPYHLWTFDTAGRLIGAPMLSKLEAAGWDRGAGGLRPVALEELYGSLWVNLAETPSSLVEQVNRTILARFGDLETFGRYGFEGLALGASREYDVRANWKLAVENFLECTHCAPLHPDLCRLVPTFRSGDASYHGGANGAELGTGIDAFSMTGAASRRPLPGLVREDLRRFHALVFLPNVLVVLVADHVVLIELFPIASDRTRVRCEWLFDPSAVTGDPATLDDAVVLFDTINRQDWAILERTQLGVTSRGFARGGILAPTEIQIHTFDAFVLERLGHERASRDS